ncbi:MAG: DUF2188 domain-containing protein [Acidobacteriota bacterium]
MPCRRRRRTWDVHVFRCARPAGWVVTVGRRTLGRHRTQALAVRAAQCEARRCAVDLVIHSRAGRFRSKDSYGNESPRHDREH